METVNTLIEFTEKSVAPNSDAADSVSAFVATGDFIGIVIAAAFAIVFSALAVWAFALKKQKAQPKHSFCPANSSCFRIKPLACTIIVIALSMACIICAAPKLFAAPENSLLKTDEKLYAAVDTQTGQVEIAPGTIKALVDNVYINSVQLDYTDDVSISDDCRWNLKIAGKDVYAGEIGQKLPCEQAIATDSFNCSLENMSAKTAISLIGKPVVKISFNAQKYCTTRFDTSQNAAFYADAAFTQGPLSALAIPVGSKITTNYDEDLDTWTANFKDEPTGIDKTVFVKPSDGCKITGLEVSPSDIASDMTQITPACKVWLNFKFSPDDGYVSTSSSGITHVSGAYADAGTTIDHGTFAGSLPGHTIGTLTITEDGTEKTYYVFGNEPASQFDKFDESLPTQVGTPTDIKAHLKSAQYKVELSDVANGAFYSRLDKTGGKITGPLNFDYNTPISYSTGDAGGNPYGIVTFGPQTDPLLTLYAVGDTDYKFSSFEDHPNFVAKNETITPIFSAGTLKIRFSSADNNGTFSASLEGAGTSTIDVFVNSGATVTKTIIVPEGQGNQVCHIVFSESELPQQHVYIKGNEGFEFDNIDGLESPITASTNPVAHFKDGKFKINVSASTDGALYKETSLGNYEKVDYFFVDKNSQIEQDESVTIYGQTAGVIKYSQDQADQYLYAIGNKDASGNQAFQFDEFLTSFPISISDASDAEDIQAEYKAAQYSLSLQNDAQAVFYTDEDCTSPVTEPIIVSYNTTLNQGTSIFDELNAIGVLLVKDSTSTSTDPDKYYVKAVDSSKQFSNFNPFDNNVVTGQSITVSLKNAQYSVLLTSSKTDGTNADGAFYASSDTSFAEPLSNVALDYGTEITVLSEAPEGAGFTLPDGAGLIKVQQSGSPLPAAQYYIAKGNAIAGKSAGSNYWFSNFDTITSPVISTTSIKANFVKSHTIKLNVNSATPWGYIQDYYTQKKDVGTLIVADGCTISNYSKIKDGEIKFDETNVFKGSYYIKASPNDYDSYMFDSFGSYESPVTDSQTIIVNFKAIPSYDITFTSSDFGAVYTSPAGGEANKVSSPISVPYSYYIEIADVEGYDKVKKITFGSSTKIGPFYAVPNDPSSYYADGFVDSGNIPPLPIPTTVVGDLYLVPHFEYIVANYNVTLNITGDDTGAKLINAAGSPTSSSSITKSVPEGETVSWEGAWALDEGLNTNHRGIITFSKTSDPAATDVQYYAQASDYYKTGTTTENTSFYYAFTKCSSSDLSISGSSVTITKNATINVYIEKVCVDVTLKTTPGKDSTKKLGGDWYSNYKNTEEKPGHVVTGEAYRVFIGSYVWCRLSNNGESFDKDCANLNISTTTSEDNSYLGDNGKVWAYPEGRFFDSGDSNCKFNDMYDGDSSSGSQISKQTDINNKNAPSNCSKITKTTSVITCQFIQIVERLKISPDPNSTLVDQEGQPILDADPIYVYKSSPISWGKVIDDPERPFWGYLTYETKSGSEVTYYIKPNSSYKYQTCAFGMHKSDGSIKPIVSHSENISYVPVFVAGREGYGTSNRYYILYTNVESS